MKILRVKYVGEYLLDVWFSDGTYKQVNFANFLFSTDILPIIKYRDTALFRKVKNNYGDLAWGRNNEMEISASSIHSGELKGCKLYNIEGTNVWAHSKKDAVKLQRMALAIQ